MGPLRAAVGLEDGPAGRAPLRHDGRLRALAISPDGRTILTGSHARTAQLWDRATGRPIGPAVRHESRVDLVAFRPGGRAVLSCGYKENAARLWDVPTTSFELVAEVELATQVATGMELDAEAQSGCSVSANGSTGATGWHYSDGHRKPTFRVRIAALKA